MRRSSAVHAALVGRDGVRAAMLSGTGPCLYALAEPPDDQTPAAFAALSAARRTDRPLRQRAATRDARAQGEGSGRGAAARRQAAIAASRE
jgi:hypothetical protein